VRKWRFIFLTGFLCPFVVLVGFAQTPGSMPTSAVAPAVGSFTQPEEIQVLWPQGAPGAHGVDPTKDIPTLTPFWPEPGHATGAAMVICPGGGYGRLAPHEGKDYALWLAGQGIAGFVLQYRLGSNGYHHPAMMEDVQRAIRYVRFHAGDWGLDPHRIGVMGSSAGGHLASVAVTHFDDGDASASDPIDRVGCRPDLGVLCYAVITMGDYTHMGSRQNLLGPNPSPDLVKFLSSEQQVTPQTPSCFIWATFDDATVPVRNSMEFANALLKNGVPYEIHIYQHGPHGQGLGVRGYHAATDVGKLLPWTHDLTYWLKLHHFVR
jgi:acetyl esterase/lipase